MGLSGLCRRAVAMASQEPLLIVEGTPLFRAPHPVRGLLGDGPGVHPRPSGGARTLRCTAPGFLDSELI